jgi:16S rRNA (guanine1207-N2)-methyltransferase
LIEPIFPGLSYYQPQELTGVLAGKPVRYFSKPGLPEWDRLPPAITLLAETFESVHANLICCINCGPGALAARVAMQTNVTQIWINDVDHLALVCSELTRRVNQNYQINICPEVDFPQELVGKVDLGLMAIFKGRKLNRRWLLQIWSGLKLGGRLLLAGSNDQGIQSIIKDAAELFNNFSILAYRKGNRIAQLVKTDSDRPELEWADEPGVAPGTWHEFTINTVGGNLNIKSLPGVFSYNKLDLGSHLLIRDLSDLSDQLILDVGCGYGIVGLSAAQLGAAHVDLVDNQTLSIASTAENIILNHLTNCSTSRSDLLSTVVGKSYTLILSNPPFHAGKQVDYQTANSLIQSAYALLQIGGSLRIVANRFIRYDRLMEQVFGNASVISATPSYHVLTSRKEQV